MEEKTESVNETLTSFDGVFSCLTPADKYNTLPPKGPPDTLPSLTDKELEALEMTLEGQDRKLSTYAYSAIQLNIESDLKPKDVALPSEADLNMIYVCGIDGSSQRIDCSSFYLMLARSVLVTFRYSKEGIKPYFESLSRDKSGVILVDGNIFQENIALHTKVVTHNASSGEFPMLPLVTDNSKQPILVRYNPATSNKNPKSHALGWAVKLQQALELASIGDVKTPEANFTVCVRDGPLFSTSVPPTDTVNGLSKIFAWKNKILVSCSKRVGESTLLVQALLESPTLRNYWFPGQNLTEDTLRSVATDILLLPKILKPGQRTPLMAAIPRARIDVVKQDARLTPLACYYYSRTRPHTFIRMEIPQFMWKENPEKVKKAIEIVAWQHELGHRAPLVQLFADRRCQLLPEKIILERRTNLALDENDLNFPEEY